MARPTRSWPLYVQCVGRGLRFQPDKTCLVLDLVGSTIRHDLVTLPKLAGVNELAEGEMFSQAMERGKREEQARIKLTAELESKRIELVKAREEERANRPPCPHCGSTHLNSHGKGRTGKRSFLCIECQKVFVENSSAVRIDCPACPHCQSDNTRTAGRKKSGIRWFKCKDCKKHFVPHFDYNKAKEIFPACYHCGSANTGGRGRSGGGKRCFICKDCGKTSVEGHKPFSGERPPCPRCSSSNINLARRNADGSYSFTCKDCKHWFTPGKIRRVVECPPCAYCGSLHVVGGGKNRNGSQGYICRTCNRKFTPKTGHH